MEKGIKQRQYGNQEIKRENGNQVIKKGNMEIW